MDDNIDDMYQTGVLNESTADDIRQAFEDDKSLGAAASQHLLDVAERGNERQLAATNRNWEEHLQEMERRHETVVEQARVIANAARDAATEVKNKV